MGPFHVDLFGPRSDKERRREQLRRNRRKGRAAEDQVAMELRFEYDEVERTHTGADFIARRRDWVTGEVTEETKVEVKAGNASLSDRQQRERRRSEDCEVRRRHPVFF